MKHATAVDARRGRMVLSCMLGSAVGLILLWLVFRKTEISTLTAVLRASHPLWVLLALCASLLAVVVKALRWVVLTRRTACLSLSTSVAAVFVGSAGNAVLSHLGEVPRIVMASRETGAGIPALLTSIVAERVFDLVALAVMMVALVVVDGDQSGEAVRIERILAVAGIWACLVVLTAQCFGRGLARRLEQAEAEGQASWRTNVASWLRKVSQALEIFRDGASVVGAFLLSMVMWTLFAVCILCCLVAAGVAASFKEALIVLGVNAVALILPASPGRVGTIEASFAIAMTGNLTGEATVLAAAIIYNMLMTVPLWCIGGAIWWRYTKQRARGLVP